MNTHDEGEKWESTSDKLLFRVATTSVSRLVDNTLEYVQGGPSARRPG